MIKFKIKTYFKEGINEIKEEKELDKKGEKERNKTFWNKLKI